MRDFIARALGWAWSPVLARLIVRMLPATGRHRKAHPPKHRETTARPLPTGGSPRRPDRPAARVPAQRSPYSREQAAPLNGADSALVRPYWTAHERAVRRRRRRVLWLATMGLDLDTRDIHALAGGARW